MLCDYILYHDHNPRKALELAALATGMRSGRGSAAADWSGCCSARRVQGLVVESEARQVLLPGAEGVLCGLLLRVCCVAWSVEGRTEAV